MFHAGPSFRDGRESHIQQDEFATRWDPVDAVTARGGWQGRNRLWHSPETHVNGKQPILLRTQLTMASRGGALTSWAGV